jgi:FixJ family two-component response regulator
MIDAVNGKIFIIDDDEAVRRSFSLLIRSAGFEVESFASVAGFVAMEKTDYPGCILLDIFMDGESGLELQETISQKFKHLPIIFITGYGDIPMSVTALKKGAVNFLQKPIDDHLLIEAVEEAHRSSMEIIKRQRDVSDSKSLLDTLTPREYEIFAMVITGLLNKQIALKLKIAEHTVKLHRGKITEKLGVHSVVEMVWMANRLSQNK